MSTGTSLEKRRLVSRLVADQDAAAGGPQRRVLQRTVATLVIVGLLAFLLLWLMGFFSSPREVLEIRAMVDEQIVQLQKVARNEAPLTYDNAGFRQNFERMREMSPEVRDQVRDEMSRLFRARERAEMRSYFMTPPQDRQNELDRRIKAEAAQRQAWQQQRATQKSGTGGNQGPMKRPGGGPGGAGGAGGAGAGGSGAQGNAAGRGQGGASQASAAGPGGGRPPGGRGGSEEERNARSKQRLDARSPE
ncbi:MAG: hypothetical protein HQ464_00620, partial [Planctomycetes bacterium]|nr:hypothetical protein [Planctomycetota bacterium]